MAPTPTDEGPEVLQLLTLYNKVIGDYDSIATHSGS